MATFAALVLALRLTYEPTAATVEPGKATTLSPAGIVDFVPLEELVQHAFASELLATPMPGGASTRRYYRLALPNDKSPRDRVIAEFADAIAGKPVTHTGRWGLANLEVCTAAIESSRTGNEIELRHQVAVK